eukprot:GGOE01013867.1.p1 GENE.GGOE01013867.1~~GGOE01013867.1.p1  ORF type:complete len:635 (+),score=117.65 GGOE01013867.1:268-1905(+)
MVDIQDRWEQLQSNFGPGWVPRPSVQRNEPSVNELRNLQQTVDDQSLEEIQHRYSVEIHGLRPPRPAETFQQGLRGAPRVQQNIEACAFKRPTPVQQYAIACCRDGRDLIAMSQTGSGKTAAFLLPILSALEMILTQQWVSSGCGLILSPTRELATQTYDECRKFACGVPITMALLVGGEPASQQMQKMRQGAHLWHATPGRLIDLLMRTQTWDLQFVKYLVLDEADLMLQGSHNTALTFLLDSFNLPPPGKRQTLIFAATLTPELVAYAKRLVDKELFIKSGRQGLNIRHIVHDVPRAQKPMQLLATLRSLPSDTQVLIFVNHLDTVDYLEEFLTPHMPTGCRVAGNSSRRAPAHRQRVIQQFKQRDIQCLIGTDVLARGLDFPDLECVICYDLPRHIAEYVHRVGRTGRMNHCGTAISFFDRQVDASLEQQLLAHLREQGQELPEWAQFTVDVPEYPMAVGPCQDNAQWGTGSSSQPSAGTGGWHAPWQADSHLRSAHNGTWASSTIGPGQQRGGPGLVATGPSRRNRPGRAQEADRDLISFD